MPRANGSNEAKKILFADFPERLQRIAPGNWK